MELICPSCEARYQVPPGAIGEKGRQVSCMNCGHSWHAYPPLVLGREDSVQSPSAGLNWQGPDGVVRREPAAPDPAPAEAAETRQSPQLAAGIRTEPRRSDISRSEQLAEIREMLAEVQSEDRAAAALASDTDATEPERPSLRKRRREAEPTLTEEAAAAAAAARAAEATDEPAPAARPAPAEPADPDHELPADRFRAHAHRVQERARAARPADVRKLRRAHDRKVSRQHRAKAAGSGAFLTGLLLVAIIAAVMIALYVLHPQIIERMPGTEAALNEYVATIDGLRVNIAETYADVRDWVAKQLDDKA